MIGLLLAAAGALTGLLFLSLRRLRSSRSDAHAQALALQQRVNELEKQRVRQLEQQATPPDAQQQAPGSGAEQPSNFPQPQRQWLAVFAHELRSPLSAIVGYSELLADGALGPLDDRAADAVNRTRLAADQLLRLIEGIEHLFASTHREEVPATISARDLFASVVDSLHLDAEARGTSMRVDDADLSFTAPMDDIRRCLVLAAGAALKVSPGATIRLSAPDSASLCIDGTQLDPRRDAPDATGDDLTGAGLRIGLARSFARRAGGSLTLHESAAGTQIRIVLPAHID